jgi:hypothetical protein
VSAVPKALVSQLKLFLRWSQVVVRVQHQIVCIFESLAVIL